MAIITSKTQDSNIRQGYSARNKVAFQAPNIIQVLHNTDVKEETPRTLMSSVPTNGRSSTGARSSCQNSASSTTPMREHSSQARCTPNASTRRSTRERSLRTI